jgi:hypothetical protein
MTINRRAIIGVAAIVLATAGCGGGGSGGSGGSSAAPAQDQSYQMGVTAGNGFSAELVDASTPDALCGGTFMVDHVSATGDGWELDKGQYMSGCTSTLRARGGTG